MNNVTMIANLTRDVELRYTPQGTAVATLGVAVNDGFGDNKKSFFFNVIVWKDLAERCNQYLSKGKKVGITGKLTQRAWDNQEGKRQSVVEIQAFNVQFLSPKNENAQGPHQTDLGPQEEEIVIPNEEELF